VCILYEIKKTRVLMLPIAKVIFLSAYGMLFSHMVLTSQRIADIRLNVEHVIREPACISCNVNPVCDFDALVFYTARKHPIARPLAEPGVQDWRA
jgi:hypothetical protein